MAGENGYSAFSTIMDFLRKWYPIPSGLLIGTGILLFTEFLLLETSNVFYYSWNSRFAILLWSILIMLGWIVCFASSRKIRLAFELKSLGIGFVGFGYLLFISTFWTPQTEDVGEFAYINPGFCLALFFLIFIVPITYAAFWSGIVMDSLPELKRSKHYFIALISFLFPFITFGIAIVLESGAAFFLLCLLYGFHSIGLGYSIFKRRRKAEKFNEFDPGLITEAKERVMLEKLDESGFKG